MNNRGIIYYWGQFECGKFILFQNGFHILNWSQQFDFTLLGCPAHLHLVSISSQCDVVQWLMNIMKTSSVSMNILVLFHVLCFIYADKIFLKDLFILTSKQIGIIYKCLYLFKRQESSKLWYSFSVSYALFSPHSGAQELLQFHLLLFHSLQLQLHDQALFHSLQ